MSTNGSRNDRGADTPDSGPAAAGHGGGAGGGGENGSGGGAGGAAGSVTRTRYATAEVEEATELLRSLYMDHEPAFSGDRADFALRIGSEAVSSPSGALRVDRLRHTMAATAPVEPTSTQLTAVVALSGRFRYVWGRREAHSVLMAPSWTRFRTDWDDIDLLICALDPDAVRRMGAEMSGLEPAEVAFTGMTPVSPARARAFASLLVHLKRDVLPHDDALDSSLVRAETFRHLAVTVLTTFPNTALDAVSDPDARGPGRAEPGTVRRAVAFVDAHAGEAIGLAEIAAAAGVGVRGLQHAFARHRDVTPLGYLRRVRLEGAHRDLVAADPTAGDTVAAIAARWGFANPGRFAVEYRRQFGRSPSTTLRE